MKNTEVKDRNRLLKSTRFIKNKKELMYKQTPEDL